MKTCFASIGSRGDLQPIHALGLRARARGHEVLVCGPPNFAPWFEGHGLAFRGFGSDIQAWLARHDTYLSGNPVTILKGMNAYVAQEFVPQFEALTAAAEGSDAIVCAGLAWSGVSVAEKLGVPCLNVVYSTSILPSRLHPPPMVPWQRLPGPVNVALWRASEFGLSGTLGAAINEGRRRIGLPRVRFAEHMFDRSAFAIAADEVLMPADPEWPSAYSRAGFIEFEDPSPLDPALDAWLSEGAAPVFVGFGSMSGGGTARVQSMLTEALSGLGLRVLVGAGWGGLGGGALPPSFRVVTEAPHAKLFPRCAVAVHHGGSGTTATALRAGVRQVVLPLILDQFHHAHRLHAEGLAPAVLPMEKVTPASFARAIRDALALPDGPRLAARERIRNTDGAGLVLDRVESLVAARASNRA